MTPVAEKTSLGFVQDTMSDSHIYEEDVHKNFSIIFWDGSVINRTADEVVRAVKFPESTICQTRKIQSYVFSQVQKLHERLQN